MRQRLKHSVRQAFGVLNRVVFGILAVPCRVTGAVRGRLVDRLPGERPLVLAPHFDDEMIGCGGAILTHLDAGDTVSLCFLTTSGGHGRSFTAMPLAEERRVESVTVARAIGIPEQRLHCLGVDDGKLMQASVAADLLAIVRQSGTDVIYAPCLMDTHADHYAVTRHLCAMLEQAPDLGGLTVRLYDVQSPTTVFHANVYLALGGRLAERKSQSLRRYRSQGPLSFSHDLDQANGWLLGKRAPHECYLETTLASYRSSFGALAADDRAYDRLRARLVRVGGPRSVLPGYLSAWYHKQDLRRLTS